MILGDDEARSVGSPIYYEGYLRTEIRTREEARQGRSQASKILYPRVQSLTDNADMECDAMANMGTRHGMGLGKEGERYAKLRPYLEISESIIQHTLYIHTP